MLAAFNTRKNLEAEQLLPIFRQKLAEITPVNNNLRPQAQDHLDNLTKPLGSLGRLEDVAAQLFCIAGGKTPLAVDKAMMFTIAADHGVVAEGVSSAAQEVTRQMLQNFLAGGAGVNVLCRNAGWDFMAVDAGVVGPALPPAPALLNAKIAEGTANIAQGPAMSAKETLLALLLGMDLAAHAAQRGYRCLGAGEMGIGNTTPSSALFCAWLGLSPQESVGPGAGLRPEALAHKAEVIARAIAVNHEAIASGDALEVLAALGGLEIAVMAGLMLGAAIERVPMLVDGFIATAAFVAACKLHEAVADYCIFAHCSAESAHKAVLEKLGRSALLDLGLRLGEGTGAAVALPLLRGAAAIYNDMASFAGAGVTPNT